MSDPIIPDVEITSDVAVAEAVEITEPAVNYSEKTLAELVALFEELAGNEERMKMAKEAEAIKAAFYKRLAKEKADAGIAAAEVAAEESEEADVLEEDSITTNPFIEIERGFKEIYASYKKERAECNRQLEKEREHNLALKEAVIADLLGILGRDRMIRSPVVLILIIDCPQSVRCTWIQSSDGFENHGLAVYGSRLECHDIRVHDVACRNALEDKP